MKAIINTTMKGDTKVFRWYCVLSLQVFT